MSLTVTVRDNETGETDSAQVPDGDFLLICTEPCRLDSTQNYPTKGTVVLTIKGRATRLDRSPRKPDRS
jgi:hypothetical protein